MRVQFLTWQFSVERVRPTAQELVGKYNSLAHKWQQKIQCFGYDKAYANLFKRLAADFRDSFARHGAPPSTIKVLDCGFGSGALSAALFNSGLGNLELHGVDTSPQMAKIARTQLAQQDIPIETSRQDVRILNYADNTFGIVMAAHTIEHLPVPQVGLVEMVRVLQPDAPLLIVTTRPGFLGSLIDARWGLTCLDETALVNALVTAGLRDVRPVQLDGRHWCRHMSYAVVGWKK